MASANQLRIRDNGTIRRIEIPEDILKVLQKTVAANIMENSKKTVIKKLIHGSPCSGCGGIPTLEVRYPVGDERQSMTKVERYCEACIKKVYAREQVL